MKEVEFTVISDDSDQDDEPATNDEPDVVEPSKRPILQDASTSRKLVPPQRNATPKLSLTPEASRRATQPPEEVVPVSIPPPASPEDKWRIRELEAEVSLPKRIGSTGCFAFCSSASAAPTPPPPPMANCPKLQIALARRGQEKGEWDGELDEDGEGPRSDLDRALWRAGLKTPAAGSKISTGKTPTVPMESMTAFLEEMKTVKLKSRVGPTPKASIVGVEEDDNCDDVGNNTFAFRRQEDLQSVLERLRKIDLGAALFGERP
ncbi:unnamed protein product [Rhizoctonia solani]|uniref:Uncharacterized protein n=1 Tax=Rhizoctonia solani TaxID=456999 RepID=A0A8H3HFI3_9AGAM|nr:unnamed protein product [Rhizoctonia solani]